MERYSFRIVLGESLARNFAETIIIILLIIIIDLYQFVLLYVVDKTQVWNKY